MVYRCPSVRSIMVRLYATGTIGSTNGMKWIYNAPANDDIDADNDSVMTPNHGALIDLSDLSSQILGKQVSQLASYTIKNIHVSLRNVDDAYDNDDSNYFKGTIRWHYPTQHKLNALKLARDADKFAEGGEIDVDSFFLRTEDRYTGMRLGWHNSGTSDWENEQVRFQSAEGFSAMPGTQWNLDSVFTLYNTMHDNSGKTNALWTGRAGTMTQKIPWVVSAMNRESSSERAHSEDWHSGIMSSKCLAGLMFLNVSDSGGDEESEPPVDIDDDYKIVVSIEYEVGVDA